ncbi:hypothetical protein ACFY0Z_29475 [Streptomyces kronopolitis]|uniref:hypothetical protein n=1 Tax=Streptomyces kronopolitis TaxID=1612435 RepID=UPI0036AF0E94
MGKISVNREQLNRLLADGSHDDGVTYQRAFEHLAQSHRGQPVGEILALLRRAADDVRLEFTRNDLLEQARAISEGQPYELRVLVT